MSNPVEWREGEVQAGAPPGSATRTNMPLLYALAQLQLVVTLGWMAYRHFQPQLLERFHLSAFSTPLAYYLGVAGSMLAPLVGGLGDRVARRGRQHTPLLVTGGLLAGATFVAVATVVAVEPTGSVRWALLGLIAVWIAAMVVLQTPALALLPAVARDDRLPIVASPLVMATVLPTALWPWAQRVLNGLGGPLVFVAGGAAVVIAAFVVRRSCNAAAGGSASVVAPQATAGLLPMGAAFLLGLASAFVTQVVWLVVPGILASNLGNYEATSVLMSTATLGASVVFAPSLAPVGVAAGARRTLLASLAIAALCAAVAPFCGSILSAAAVAVVMGAALALYLDCAAPLAFELLPSSKVGLAAGLYLGGLFAGSQLAGLSAHSLKSA